MVFWGAFFQNGTALVSASVQLFVSLTFCPVKFCLSGDLSSWYFDYLIFCLDTNLLMKFCLCSFMFGGILSE